MIRPCVGSDFDDIYRIINSAAIAYKGVIPADRWHEPYMSKQHIQEEIDAKVKFHGWVDMDGAIKGVMGIQDVRDVTLIRHAYVLPSFQHEGIGSALLDHLLRIAGHPVLVGTWKAATWAVAFYEAHGFRLVNDCTKNELLKTYWSIPDRQVETSVVLRHHRDR